MKYRIQETLQVTAWVYVEALDREQAVSMLDDGLGSDPLENIISKKYLATNWETLQDERD